MNNIIHIFKTFMLTLMFIIVISCIVCLASITGSIHIEIPFISYFLVHPFDTLFYLIQMFIQSFILFKLCGYIEQLRNMELNESYVMKLIRSLWRTMIFIICIQLFTSWLLFQHVVLCIECVIPYFIAIILLYGVNTSLFHKEEYGKISRFQELLLEFVTDQYKEDK